MHVIVAVGPQFDGAVPALGRHCCNGAKDIHLSFLAAKPTAHPADIDGDRMRGDSQNMGHHMLGLTGVLG